MYTYRFSSNEAVIHSHLDEFMFKNWMDLTSERTLCFSTVIRVHPLLKLKDQADSARCL